MLLYSTLVLVLSHRYTETEFAGQGASGKGKNLGEAWGQNSLVSCRPCLGNKSNTVPLSFLALSNYYCLRKGQNGVSSASQNLNGALPVSSSKPRMRRLHEALRLQAQNPERESLGKVLVLTYLQPSSLPQKGVWWNAWGENVCLACNNHPFWCWLLIILLPL